MTCRVGASLACVAVLVSAMPAAAQDPMQAAIECVDDADFVGAIDAFEAVLQERSLTRAQIARLLAYRAVVHHALGDHEAMQADLARLAKLAPSTELPPSAPPPVQVAWQAASASVAPIDVPEPTRVEPTVERPSAPFLAADDADREDDAPTPLFWAIGAGAAALVTVAVIGVIVASSGSDERQTALGGPAVTF